MKTPQAEMKAALEKIAIAKKSIEVFGSQIIITCWSEKAARQWALVLAKFARKIRGVVRSLDQTIESKGRKPEYVEVYRIGAAF